MWSYTYIYRIYLNLPAKSNSGYSFQDQHLNISAFSSKLDQHFCLLNHQTSHRGEQVDSAGDQTHARCATRSAPHASRRQSWCFYHWEELRKWCFVCTWPVGFGSYVSRNRNAQSLGMLQKQATHAL